MQPKGENTLCTDVAAIIRQWFTALPELRLPVLPYIRAFCKKKWCSIYLIKAVCSLYHTEIGLKRLHCQDNIADVWVGNTRHNLSRAGVLFPRTLLEVDWVGVTCLWEYKLYVRTKNCIHIQLQHKKLPFFSLGFTSLSCRQYFLTSESISILQTPYQPVLNAS